MMFPSTKIFDFLRAEAKAARAAGNMARIQQIDECVDELVSWLAEFSARMDRIEEINQIETRCLQ
jgi:hypothetical protein